MAKISVWLKICLLSFAVMIFGGLATQTVSAQAKQDVLTGVCAGAEVPAECKNSTGESRITKIIEVAVNIVSLVGGVIVLITLIMSGIKFANSSGDPGKVSAARNSLIYALVGLVVIALAQFIVRFVVTRVDNTPDPVTPPAAATP